MVIVLASATSNRLRKYTGRRATVASGMRLPDGMRSSYRRRDPFHVVEGAQAAEGRETTGRQGHEPKGRMPAGKAPPTCEQAARSRRPHAGGTAASERGAKDGDERTMREPGARSLPRRHMSRPPSSLAPGECADRGRCWFGAAVAGVRHVDLRAV